MIIAIKRLDGVSIMRMKDTAVLAEEIAKWESVNSPAVSFREITEAELPDREFRDSWEDAGTITENLAKAKVIQGTRIFHERFRKITEAENDINIFNVTDDPSRSGASARKAQLESINLTTIGASVKNAPNITALKNAWPNGL